MNLFCFLMHNVVQSSSKDSGNHHCRLLIGSSCWILFLHLFLIEKRIQMTRIPSFLIVVRDSESRTALIQPYGHSIAHPALPYSAHPVIRNPPFLAWVIKWTPGFLAWVLSWFLIPYSNFKVSSVIIITTFFAPVLVCALICTFSAVSSLFPVRLTYNLDDIQSNRVYLTDIFTQYYL